MSPSLCVQARTLSVPDTIALRSHANALEAKWEHGQGKAYQDLLTSRNSALVSLLKSGKVNLMYLGTDGQPVFYTTDNADAARSIRTDEIYPGSAPPDLTGAGINFLGMWDGGAVRTSHQELAGRVMMGPNQTSTIHPHSTHVAGTMIATGVQSAAKGMAYDANLTAWDYGFDDVEMAYNAAWLRVSNHSYSQLRGWNYVENEEEWWWNGDVSISESEDYKFGFYDSTSYWYDVIANDAPGYLMVFAAGNERNDDAPAPGTVHNVFQNGTVVEWTGTHDDDGGAAGWDCIGQFGCTKNALTVGAVSDVSFYVNPSDVVVTSFTSFGPTDDGRIKPDIAANGYEVYSSSSDSDVDYATESGTSMAAPSVAASAALLIQYYQQWNNEYPMSSTIKGLIIHTADEAGDAPGPDYRFGWGLMNTHRAADLIAEDNQESFPIQERTLANGQVQEFSFWSDGTEPIRATICWNDPAGPVPPASLDPDPPILVNDLDLRIIRAANSEVNFPFALLHDNESVFAAPAYHGDNDRDNVEQILIPNPAVGEYVVRVQHKATLDGGAQDFALIVSGFQDHTPPAPITDLAVFRTDLSGFASWTATGDDGTEGRAVQTLRMSTNPITEASFDLATLLYQDEHLGGGINGAFFEFPFTDETYYLAMRVCDEADNCSPLSNVVTETIPLGEIEPGPHIEAAEYFIDSDPGVGQGTPLLLQAGVAPFGNWTVSIAGLAPGVHHLNIRMRDETGNWFSPMRRSFAVISPQLTSAPSDVRAEVSFDQEPNGINSINLPVTPGWDVVLNDQVSPGELEIGLHDLYLRMIFNDTLISASHRRKVLVTPALPEGGQRIVASEYFVDADPGEGLGWLLVPDAGNDVTLAANFPADTMTPGMHHLNLRVRSVDGMWSSPARRPFYVGRSGSLLADAEYFWDDDPGHGNGMSLDFVDGYEAALTPSLSLPELAHGPHAFNLRFRSLIGEWSAPARRAIRIEPEEPAGGYAITAAEAFVDQDPGLGQAHPVLAVDGSLDESNEPLLRYISPLNLNIGGHSGYVRVQDNTGRWSTLARDSFTVIPPVEIILTTIADSLGDSVRLRWNAFPEALSYHVSWDYLAAGPYANFVTVMPPESSYVWPTGQPTELRFFRVTALLPDTTLARQSILENTTATRRLQ